MYIQVRLHKADVAIERFTVIGVTGYFLYMYSGIPSISIVVIAVLLIVCEER